MSVYHHDNARLARRLLGFLLILLGVGLMTVLYYVKIRAQSAKAESTRLHSEIQREILAINVLRAEIAHLESPERLDRLARQHTELLPTPADRVIAISDIDRLFPLRNEPQAISVGDQP